MALTALAARFNGLRLREKTRFPGCYFEQAPEISSDEDATMQQEPSTQQGFDSVLLLLQPSCLLNTILPSRQTMDCRDIAFTEIQACLLQLTEVASVSIGGSVAKGTDLDKSDSDIDIVVLLKDIQYLKDEREMQAMLVSIENQYTRKFM